MTEQLAFDLDALADLPETEAAAVATDFMARYSDNGAPRAKPCICDHPLLFAAELGEGTCGLCGREPRGR